MSLHSPDAEPTQARRILIAEDVDINREILEAVLEELGHELTFAEDGLEALDLVQQQAFDVVLMDIQMPRMDGVEATRRIRGLGGQYRELPILGLTATVTADDLVRFEAAGMTECLMKPIDWDQLNAAIARCRPDQRSAQNSNHKSAHVDLQSLDALGRAIGQAEISSLVQDGMQAYRRYHEAMVHAASGPEGVRRDAHKLKGSAGTLGLWAITRAAEAIELTFVGGDGACGRALIKALGKTIDETEAVLVDHGMGLAHS